MASCLEQCNIITNPQAFYDDSSFAAASGIRLGTQEMTRFGMGEADFEELAGIVASIIAHGSAHASETHRHAVIQLRRRFTGCATIFERRRNLDFGVRFAIPTTDRRRTG